MPLGLWLKGFISLKFDAASVVGWKGRWG